MEGGREERREGGRHAGRTISDRVSGDFASPPSAILIHLEVAADTFMSILRPGDDLRCAALIALCVCGGEEKK